MPGTLPVHVTTADDSAGTAYNEDTCGGIPGATYNNRFGVCGERFALT